MFILFFFFFTLRLYIEQKKMKMENLRSYICADKNGLCVELMRQIWFCRGGTLRGLRGGWGRRDDEENGTATWMKICRERLSEVRERAGVEILSGFSVGQRISVKDLREMSAGGLGPRSRLIKFYLPAWDARSAIFFIIIFFFCSLNVLLRWTTKVFTNPVESANLSNQINTESVMLERSWDELQRWVELTNFASRQFEIWVFSRPFPGV